MAATTTRRPAAGWVFGGSLGAFFAVLAGLGFQADAPAGPVADTPRQIVVRRVIETTVVHHRSARPRAERTSTAPATTTAPAAPAPAPAPLTTQSS